MCIEREREMNQRWTIFSCKNIELTKESTKIVSFSRKWVRKPSWEKRPTFDLDESLSLIVTTIRKQQIWILGAALYWTSKAFLLILYLMVTPCNDRIESNHRVAHSIANVNRTSMPRNLTLYSCALLQKDRYQVRANTNIKMIRNLMTMMIIIRKILP